MRFYVWILMFFLIFISACSKLHLKTQNNISVEMKSCSVDSIEKNNNATELKQSVDETLPEGAEIVEDTEIKEYPEDTKLSPKEEKLLKKPDALNFQLDIYETKELKFYFKYYANIHRKTFTKWLKRAQKYLPFVRKVFKEQGLPEDLIFLPFAESGYNPWAYSRAGAAGMWQFMPKTARKYGLRVDWWVDERRDPFKSTYAAAKMLKELYAMFGDWYLALAAYNAGPGKICKAIRRSKQDDFFAICKKNRRYLRRETRHYVPKFLAILKIVQNLEELGFPSLNLKENFVLVQMEVAPRMDLLALSNYVGLSWHDFRQLNPAIRRMVAPPDRKIMVYLPKDKVDLAQKFIKECKKIYAGILRYKVRMGDSWWRISRRYGVPISVLKKVNGIYSNILRPGKVIIIPKSGQKEYFSRYTIVRKEALKRANYTVQPGDSLWTIARKFGISVKTLKKANGLASSKLQIGQKLYIPDMGIKKTRLVKKSAKEFFQCQLVWYRVRRGDNLWIIAKRFGVSLKQILKWNNLGATHILRPGKKLKIYVP
ncbi:LysM peptidoglycan-binding domain-containing protein [Desulfonauticus submarinus]